jgi:hypothetical protein
LVSEPGYALRNSFVLVSIVGKEKSSTMNLEALFKRMDTMDANINARIDRLDADYRVRFEKIKSLLSKVEN